MEINYTLKKLSATDISEAKQLIALFQLEFKEAYPAITDEGYLPGILAKESFHAFVAMKNELVIGGVTAYELPMFNEKKKEMFLYDIAVAKEHWQRGIANELVNALKELCIEKGINTMFVGTDIDNEGAKKLYQKTGAEMEEIAWFTYNLE